MEEIFTFAGKTWSIKKAWEIIKERNKKIIEFEVQSAMSFIDFIEIDKKYAESEKVTLEKPCIVIEYVLHDEIFHLIIDGWHRVWKANKMGISILKCFILSPDEEKKCRIKKGKKICG